MGCHLITANGRAFCAGGDLSGAPPTETPLDEHLFVEEVDRFHAGIRALHKPVVAGVHGLCLGTGLGFVAQCDLVVASDDARFGLIEGRIGHPGGRVQPRKQPAMMIKFSGAHYSATASPAHFRDFERKVAKALDNLPAFIHVFTPCTLSWGYDDQDSFSITQLGVDCGIWPLWEWSDDDGFRRTGRFDAEGMPERLREYLGMQRRYSHVTESDVHAIERYVLDLNGLVDNLNASFAAAPA